MSESVYKVEPTDDEPEATWTFACGLCEFRSERHRTRGDASERRAEHMAEHEGEEPAELAQPAQQE